MSPNKPSHPQVVPSPALIIRADASIAETVRKMKDANVGSVLVVSDDSRAEIVGIFTERDLLRKLDLLRDGSHWEKPVRTVMSRPVRTVDVSELDTAADVMLELNVRHLPVVRKKAGGRQELLGVISMRDLLRAELKRRSDDESRGVLDIAAGSELAGRVAVVEQEERLAIVLSVAFSAYRRVTVEASRPDRLVGGPGWLKKLTGFSALVLDIDLMDPADWKSLLKEINHAADLPGVFIVFSPDLHGDNEQKLLLKLAKSRQFTPFAKPVNLSSLLLQLVPPMVV